MTRKEKELKVLELFGLKVGDKIKVQGYKQAHIYQLVEGKNRIEVSNVNDINDITSTMALIMCDWEKVEKPLKDNKCENLTCSNCVLRKYHCVAFFEDRVTEHTLGEIYNEIEKDLDKAKKEIFGEEQ